MAYITIVKGDDTDFLDNQYLVVKFNTDINMAGFKAVFSLDNIELTYPDLSAKYIEIILSNEVTSKLKSGKMYGSLKLIDTEDRIRTVTTVIPFNVITKVMNNSVQVSDQSIQMDVSINKNEFNVDMSIVGLSKTVAESYLSKIQSYDDSLTEIANNVSEMHDEVEVKAVEAASSANLAKQWANSGVLVDGTEYSAKYYADKAETISDNMDAQISDLNETLETIANTSLSNLTDAGKAVIRETAGTGLNMFDLVVKDHILTFEESAGLAQLGTYVYKSSDVNRYGYPDFYNKCLDEMQSGTAQPLFMSINVDTVGSLTNNNGVLSGFSESNYAQINQIPSSVTSFEIVMKVTTGASVTSEQDQVILGQLNNFTSPQIGLNTTTQKFSLLVADTPTSWGASIYSLNTASLNTTYWFKGTWDGTTISFYLKTSEEAAWELQGSTSQTAVEWSQLMVIGNDYAAPGMTKYFQGTIDLNGCYININGSRWWSGANCLNINKNSNGHIFYDIADKAIVDAYYEEKGAAWFYGVDTVNERIFLPRNNYYFKNSDSPGEYVEAGVPNIEGYLYQGLQVFDPQSTGAFILTAPITGKRGGYNITVTDEYSSEITFDASLSNPIYGNSDTVQPPGVNAVVYMVVGNTTSEVAISNITEVTTTENDTLPLLCHIASDEELNHTSWLLSAGQWNSGSVYSTAYNYLVSEYTEGTPKTDTITAPDGTEYTVSYKVNNGKKIVDVANITQVENLYNAIGSAWYYVLDQSNIQFKLPRSKNMESYTSDVGRLGLDISAGLPNIEGTWGSAFEDANTSYSSTGAVTSVETSGFNMEIPNNSAPNYITRTFDASLSNPIYGNSDTVTPAHTEFYLYFKVANAVQNLQLLNAGEITSALTEKADKDFSNCTKPYVTETYVNGASWYRVWSDGLIEQGGHAPVGSGSITYLKSFTDINYSILAHLIDDDATWHTIIWNRTTSGCYLREGQFELEPRNLTVPAVWYAYGY